MGSHSGNTGSLVQSLPGLVFDLYFYLVSFITMKTLKAVSALALCVTLVKAVEIVDDEADAIVITAPPKAQQNRESRQLLLSYPLVKTLYVGPIFPSLATVPYPPSLRQQQVQCQTKDGRDGTCMTMNECFPKRKIFKLAAHDTWAMGLYNTCQRQSVLGIQVTGYCCPNDKAEQEANIRRNVPAQSEAPQKQARAQACLLESKQKSQVKNTRCKRNNQSERRVTWRNIIPLRPTDNWRIVNGEQAVRNEYPFIAALLASDSKNNKRQFCGGSLIDEWHVSTAAHCVIGYTERDINMLRVRLGAHYLSDSGQTSEHRVDRIIRHIDFKQTTLDYDVAILTLSTPAPTGASNIGQICLPSIDINYEGYQSVVAGWGSTRAIGFSQPDVLKKVVVEIWDNPRCARSYGSDAPGGITDRMMCANLPGKDSCQGDSGGPLFTSSSNGKFTQIGIVSWGISCAHEKYPGVYSRVTALQEWIDRITSCY